MVWNLGELGSPKACAKQSDAGNAIELWDLIT